MNKKLLLGLAFGLFAVSGGLFTGTVQAADRFWVGGGSTTNWDATGNTNWSATSGGANNASVPSATDDVFFDTNSSIGDVDYTVTIASPATAHNFSMEGIGGAEEVTWAGSSTLAISGSLDILGCICGIINTYTGDITFNATSGTNIITSNGITYASNFIFDGVGGTWQLGSNLTTGVTHTITLTRGTFDANDFNVTSGLFASSNTNVRTINMGSGTWTLSGTAGSVWNINDPSNLTLNSETSTVSIGDTGAGQKIFQGGAKTYYNAIFGGNNVLITNTNTFDSLHVENAGQPQGLIFQNTATQVILTNFVTNASAGNLAKISSDLPGTPFVLSKSSGTVSVDYMVITDSTAEGGAHWYAGANSTNGGGNTGWIFTAVPTDRYWVGGTGTWNGTDTTHWAYYPGGPGGAPVPASTNDCFFDASSFSGVGQTVTILTADASCLDMTWTSTDAPTLAMDNGRHLNIYGSLTFAAGMTVGPTSNDYILFLAPTGTHTITTNGVSVNTAIYFYGAAGVWELQDNFGTDFDINPENGTFDANNFNVTAGSVGSSVASTRAINMGSGTWTLTGASGNVWNITDSTNLTFDAGTSSIIISDTGGLTKAFFGGGLTYNIATFSGDLVVIQDSNTFNAINVDNAVQPTGLFFANGTTQTVTNFTTNGSSGNLAMISASSPGTPFILSKSSGTISVDYMDITDSTATGGAAWYAGANSTDGGGNTGWIFTPPSAASTPTASPVAGTYTSAQSVTLSSTNSTSIRYTVDGSTPSCSVGTVYSGAITVSSSKTIKAVGCDGSNIASPVASFAYTINISSGSGGSSGGSAPQSVPGFTPLTVTTITATAITVSSGECRFGDLFSNATGKLCPPIPQGCSAFTAFSPFTGKLCPFPRPIAPPMPNIPVPMLGQVLEKDLYFGMRNNDVMILQAFLKSQGPEIYPEGLVTGYFHNFTLWAVQRFQVKYGITGPGLPGYGRVGPKTRAKINEFVTLLAL